MSGTDEGLERVAGLVEELRHKKLCINDLKHELETANNAYQEIEHELLAILEAANLDKFHGENASVSIRTKSSWKVPKDPVAREAFFAFLRERGIFDEMITVHSQTLNSWANAEQEVAAASGNFQFAIPGLDEPVEYKSLTLRTKG